jgi:hypothetical protein
LKSLFSLKERKSGQLAVGYAPAALPSVSTNLNFDRLAHS